MAAQPEVSILIVNYHTASELRMCLDSVQAQQSVSYEVLVVDNGSGAGERTLLQALANDHVRIIYSEENLGFGRANNLAAQSAQAELLLILNPDTCLQQPDILRRYLDAYLQGDARLLVPVVVESAKKKKVLPRKRYPAQNLCRHTDFSHLAGEYAWALGACLLLRRTDYLSIGGFDPDYFMYGEDVDFCWRVRAQLGSIGFAADLSVHHIGGASEKGAPSMAKWLRKRQGQYLFYRKRYHAHDVQRIALQHRWSAAFKLFKNAFLNHLLGTSLRRQDEDARATATLVASAECLHIK